MHIRIKTNSMSRAMFKVVTIFFKNFLAFISNLVSLFLFKLLVTTPMWPFKTKVNNLLIFFEGFEKHIVRVTSVVPYLY